MRGRVLRILGLTSLLVSGAGIAWADFCKDLEVVLESARDGFSAVRGDLVSRHQDPLSDTRVIWQCTQALTGAQTCEVEWLRQAFTYNTFWHKQDEQTNAATFQALTELLVGCGLMQKQTSKSGRSALYGSEGQTDLDIVLAYNSRRVRLSVTASGFPNP